MRTRPAFGQGITGWAVDKREPVLATTPTSTPASRSFPARPPSQRR